MAVQVPAPGRVDDAHGRDREEEGLNGAYRRQQAGERGEARAARRHEDPFERERMRLNGYAVAAMSAMLLYACYWGLAELYPGTFVHPTKAASRAGSAMQAHIMSYKAIQQLVKPSAGEQDEGVLKLVIAFEVVGEATPERYFAYERFTYDEGPGQLTKDGILQMFEKGAGLRRRYIEALHGTAKGGLVDGEWAGPIKNQVYVRSAMQDAAMDGAHSLLLGLFPPLDNSGFVFGQETVSKRPLELGVSHDCGCRPVGKPATLSLQTLSGFVNVQSHSTNKTCLAACLGLAYGGHKVDGAGIQDVPVDTPLEMSKDWLLLQSQVCSTPLTEVRLAEDVDDKWTSYKQSVASTMREIRKLAGCKPRDQAEAHAADCQLCTVEDTGRGKKKRKKQCSPLQLQDVPLMLRHLQVADKYSKNSAQWMNHEGMKHKMKQISTWMWYSRYKPELVGKQHGGLLLGEILNCIEAATAGEKQERLVVNVIPEETLANLIMALALKAPVPPQPGEELVMELRERTQEHIRKSRKTADGWASVLTGTEGLWMVRFLRNNQPVQMHGCPNGYCSVARFRQALADRILDPQGSAEAIRDACFNTLVKPVPPAQLKGTTVIGR
eukprot:jgi/Tetstr1/461268/TSEL_006395.t1